MLTHALRANGLIGSLFTSVCNLIVHLPYLLSVPTRPSGAVCAVIRLLRGDSAEDQLAHGPPLPGEFT